MEKRIFHEKTSESTKRPSVAAFWALVSLLLLLFSLLFVMFALLLLLFVLLFFMFVLLLLILLVLFSCVAAVWCSLMFVQLASACAAPVVCALLLSTAFAAAFWVADR